MSSVTLVHRAKAVEWNEMSFGRDTLMVPSNIALDLGPGPPRERGDLGVGTPNSQRCRISPNHFCRCFMCFSAIKHVNLWAPCTDDRKKTKNLQTQGTWTKATQYMYQCCGYCYKILALKFLVIMRMMEHQKCVQKWNASGGVMFSCPSARVSVRLSDIYECDDGFSPNFCQY